MFPTRWDDFPTTWSIDFEYATNDPTGRPVPHTFVATELGSERQVRLAGNRLRHTRRAPFDVHHSLTLAYNFVAESQCFEVLGWEQPRWPMDPYAEHLALTNGVFEQDSFEAAEDEYRIRYREVDALRFYGVDVPTEQEAYKHQMQLRAAEGEPFSPAEWAAVVDYCADDTTRLIGLFRAMRPRIDFPAALVRGRYMVAIGQQVHRGIPVDAPWPHASAPSAPS